MDPALSGSFAFESPEWLRGLWALPVVVLFYLFRRRARRILVPFLPFWERVFAERKRRPSFLRTFLSIFLQIIAAASILVALARPYREESRGVPVPSIVVLDRSLGTKIQSAQGSLAEAAAARARAVATRAAALGPVSVAILRGGLEPLGSASDPERVTGLLGSLPPPAGTRKLDDLATLRRATDPETRVFLITPFATGPADLAGVTVIGVATEPLRNGGIRGVTQRQTDLVVVADPGGQDRTLRLFDSDGNEIAAAPVAASGKAEARLAIPPSCPQEVTLRLEPADAFPDDDVAPLELPERGKIRVVLASDVATPALDSALVASAVMDPGTSGRVALGQLSQVVDSFDVAIVVGTPGDTALRPGRYFLIDSLPPGVPIAVKGEAGEARALRKAEAVGWLSALDVEEWKIHRMALLEALPGLEVLVEGTRGPLVSRFEQGGARGVALSVAPDLATSTLPLLPAFPLMLRGVLLELAPGLAVAGPVVHRAGGRIVLSAAEAGDFTREDGSPVPLRLAKDGGGFELPEEVGRFTTGSRRIATAWLDHAAVPGEPVTSDDAWPEPPRRPARRSLQAEVLLILVAVLLAEWCSYHFGATD